jgi:type IV pilus assembly protein PilY1
MSVTADFGSGTQTRTFYSAYFILDITNPERNPVLLWSYSSPDLGFATSYPTVVRANPSTSPKTDGTNEKWFVVVGTGVSGYDGSVMGPHGSDPGQIGKLVSLEMPKPYAAGSALVVSKFPTADVSAFGPIIGVDTNLDFRTDVTYQGTLMSSPSTPPPTWIGKLSRLMLNSGDTSTTTWGVPSGSGRAPTLLLSTFPASGPTQLVGPITAGATASADDSNNIWVFFGTGRFYNQADKANTDAQYFFGVKDPVVTGGCTDSLTGCQKPNLLNVSNAQICTVCTGGLTQVSGLSGITSFDTGSTSLVGTVQSMDGWYTRLPSSGERVLSNPTLLGGTVFFTTFIPDNDICDAAGTGNVYALFYLTGTAYKSPIIGQTTTGGNTFNNTSVSLGTGLPSQMAVQIGQQGSGVSGAASGGGCQGSVIGFIQGITGAINQLCAKPALTAWSRYVSWNNERD